MTLKQNKTCKSCFYRVWEDSTRGKSLIQGIRIFLTQPIAGKRDLGCVLRRFRWRCRASSSFSVASDSVMPGGEPTALCRGASRQRYAFPAQIMPQQVRICLNMVHFDHICSTKFVFNPKGVFSPQKNRRQATQEAATNGLYHQKRRFC